MFGDVFLLERDGADPIRAERLAFGETAGRNEAWLRDTLFQHPELLPLRDIDPSFGPLVPLCTELRTEAGPLDIAFINKFGRLTLVECKLWRNPEARRKVVAQALDYARAISRWSYSDLQRQVAAATGKDGNVPFQHVLAKSPGVTEQRFVDDTTRAMRSGRFLLVIAGDGIREDVGGIADLINRNAASAFSFGLVEVALYGFADSSLAIQPRVITKTQLIERTVVVVRDATERGGVVTHEETETEEPGAASDDHNNELGESLAQAQYRAWWAPVIDVGFDDPDQEPAKLYWPNNVRALLPWPTKVWVTAYRYGGDTGSLGVGTNGKEPGYGELFSVLASQRDAILAELPEGTEFRRLADGRFAILVHKRAAEFTSEDEKRRWLSATLNAFVNTLRPRLKTLAKDLHETR
jgi:hypothetical protein